jgi:Type I phosphodiesterase / nucleotide pyrophosphatase
VTGDIYMSKLADLEGVEIAPNATEFKFYSSDPKRIERLYAELKGKDPRIAVYRRGEIPERLHYSNNPRIGDLVALATQPVFLHLAEKPGQSLPKGMHGYDAATMPQMRAVFFAAGPDLKSGLTIDEFQNIHIYPLIAHILGLKMPAGIDGQLSVLATTLNVKAAAATAGSK